MSGLMLVERHVQQRCQSPPPAANRFGRALQLPFTRNMAIGVGAGNRRSQVQWTVGFL